MIESATQKAEVVNLRAEVANLVKYLNDRISNAVDVNVVNTLHEYYLLKDGNPSSEYMAHEIRAIVLESIALSK